MDAFNSKVGAVDQLMEKIEKLEDKNTFLAQEVDRLDGIRGALEEKVSAYRFRLKELIRQLESVDISPLNNQKVYHNRDELERRRFVIRRPNPVVDCQKVNGAGAENAANEKYDRLLEQYMHERERNEQLFDYLFSKEKKATLDLFIREDAADTLLEATTLSRVIIEQAELKARKLEAD